VSAKKKKKKGENTATSHPPIGIFGQSGPFEPAPLRRAERVALRRKGSVVEQDEPDPATAGAKCTDRVDAAARCRRERVVRELLQQKGLVRVRQRSCCRCCRGPLPRIIALARNAVQESARAREIDPHREPRVIAGPGIDKVEERALGPGWDHGARRIVDARVVIVPGPNHAVRNGAEQFLIIRIEQLTRVAAPHFQLRGHDKHARRDPAVRVNVIANPHPEVRPLRKDRRPQRLLAVLIAA
jgi:hypothetical protein